MIREIARCALFLPVFLNGCGGSTLAGTGTDDADGGTHPDSGTPVNTCLTTCLDSELSWDYSGGLADFSQVSNLSSCSAYSHQEGSGSGDLSCTDTVSQDCNASGITAGQVAGAFSNADVQAAFAGSTPLYGSDPRGCDGTVREIIYKSKTISVGGDCASGNSCGGTAKCVDIPAGLQALSDLLVALDKQELETKNCASVFPGR